MDGQTKEIAEVQSQAVAVQPSEEGQFMNLIAEMMRDKDADMTKLERLLALRDQEKAARNKAAFDVDYVQMKPKLPRVVKSHNNTQTNSKYAKLEDINTIIDPILANFGFGTASKVIRQTASDVTMLLQLRHRNGHYDEMELTLPIDNEGAQGKVNKTVVHGISSTITYIKRVGFCAMLNISTGDDKDGNKTTEPQPITIEQAADIDNRARKLGDDYFKRFLEWAKVEQVTNIMDVNYKKVIAAISAAEAEHKKKAK